MTEQEFLEIVSLYAETWYRPKSKPNRWNYDTKEDWKIRSGEEIKNINLDDVLLVEWCTGGIGGGNCWNKRQQYAFDGDPEPSMDVLEVILDQVVPNMSRRDYKLLLTGATPGLIEHEAEVCNEYYGNETHYGRKVVSLRRLWERLQGLGLV